MRYKPRVTRAIALGLLLCVTIYLYAADGILVPTSLSDRLRSLQSSSSKHGQPAPEKIQLLWSHWSKVFNDTRPSANPIRLNGNANIVGISSDDSEWREPSPNRVSNPESDIESLQASHAALMKILQSELPVLQSEDVAGDIFNGTGIVMVGGGEYFGPAIIGLHMLRKTGSTLPVEIFVADQSEYEVGLCDEYLPKYGARCLVIADYLQIASEEQIFKVTHYQLKSLAMLFSSFAEILYLDSDSIPLVDPSEFFAAEPYLSNGLIIWPDFWIATESPLFYTIAGGLDFPYTFPKTSSEAGQLLVNKRTHLKTLLLATYYNLYGPGYYYPLLSQGVIGQGDKETFMAAAFVTDQSYYRVKTRVASIGRHNGAEHKGSGMVQHHPSDDFSPKEGNQTVRPAFVHANMPKMNAGHLADEGDLFTVDQKRLRLWGSQAAQEERFGCDLEKVVWELLVQTGCDLEHVLGEWKGRKRLCGRLEEHWKDVF